MTVREISKEEFIEFTKNFPLESVYQTGEYSEVMQEQGYQPIFVGAFKEKLVAASLILVQTLKKYKYAIAPRGFLMDYSDKPLLEQFTKELKTLLNSKDIIAIKISPIIVKSVMNRDGEVIATNPDFEEIFNTLKKLGYYHFGFNSLFEAMRPRYEAILDLSVGYQTLFKNIQKEYKTKIRTAGRRGIKIFKADEKDMNLLYEQVKNKYPRDIKYFEDAYKYFSKSDKIVFYYAKLDTAHYLNVIQEEYEKLEKITRELDAAVVDTTEENTSSLLAKKMDADRQFESIKTKLLEATNLINTNPDGAILASVLVIKGNKEVYLFMDGIDKDYKSFSAKHLIIWKVIEKYAELGFRLFNMGGITDITLKSKYSGLNKFKTNFNPSVIEYPGDFELVINGAKYFMFKKNKKIVKKTNQI